MCRAHKRPACTPICSTPGCSNKKAPARLVCHKCRARDFRERNPITASFHNLKHRAKERGHKFTITIAEFRAWCEKTSYHLLKGKHADGMSIDRIRETEGYHIGNIQMMTLGQNSLKENYRRIGMAPPQPDKPYTDEDRPW